MALNAWWCVCRDLEATRIRIQDMGVTFWLAQDTYGCVWALQFQSDVMPVTTFGVAGAMLFMPIDPVAGQAYEAVYGNCVVLETNVSVPMLSTGVGPFIGCLKIQSDNPVEPGRIDYLYSAPGYGLVKNEVNVGVENKGWELVPDTDRDGLPDWVESLGCTDPNDADTDDDGWLDGWEDENRNGVHDSLNEDLDFDLMLDQGEDTNHNGILDPGEDVDLDGVLDLTEDLNGNGLFDLPGEDIDLDGYFDNVNEDVNANGILDWPEVDPCNADTDGDGIQDGTEWGLTLESPMVGPDTDLGVFIPDADPLTMTDNLNPDSDGDGLSDGQEDANANGMIDPGERDPNEMRDYTFDVSSAALTNPFVTPFQMSVIVDFAGYGDWAGYEQYWLPSMTEVVDSVECLVVQVQGFGNHPDPDQDTGVLFWLAQDTDGCVWTLQVQQDVMPITTFGVAGAWLFMPIDPVAGQAYEAVYGNCVVLETNVSVPMLSTGVGPFTGCLKIQSDNPVEPGRIDNLYTAPGYGLVKQEVNVGVEVKGWELVQASSCIFSLSLESQMFDENGGPGSVDVNASDDICDWIAVSNDGWISITTGSSGTGNGTVSYSVAVNNTGSGRSGTLTIAENTFTVNQSSSTLPDSNVLHIESSTTDGNTTFLDNSTAGHSITHNGDVHHSIFGNDTAILYDGASDYLSLADSDVWDFGTGDFTISLWVNFASVPDNYDGIFSAYDYLAASGYSMYIYDDTIRFNSTETGLINTGFTPVANDWCHLAVVRSLNTLTIYVNGGNPATGVKVSRNCTGMSVNSSNSGLVLGRLFPLLSSGCFDGYMDEIMVYKGEARWTDSFIPPDYPGVIIPVDSDGDGLSDSDESTIYFTDPEMLDTDGDGIEDGEEVIYWLLLKGDWIGAYDADGQDNNLLDPDADGDGFIDGEEKTAASDPADDSSVPAPTVPADVLYIKSSTTSGSTVFTDESTAGHIITGYDNVKHVAFGDDTAVLCDGDGDYLSVPDHDNRYHIAGAGILTCTDYAIIIGGRYHIDPQINSEI